jgi:L-lactate dehydrogenase (cytochrome)
MVLKGILHPDDARTARAHGMDAVIVSNHGGRQLDGSLAPLQALPAIVDAAGAMEVMLDSGVRRGTDVLKALALGARCVFVGRPFNYAATVAGERGVAHAIALITEEVRRDMGLLGIVDLREVDPGLLQRGR